MTPLAVSTVGILAVGFVAWFVFLAVAVRMALRARRNLDSEVNTPHLTVVPTASPDGSAAHEPESPREGKEPSS